MANRGRRIYSFFLKLWIKEYGAYMKPVLMDNKLKRLLWITLFVVASGVGLLQLKPTLLYPQENIRSDLDRFMEVFLYVKRYYVEPVESDKLITGAIEGLLGKLDPHSVYLPLKSLEQESERMEGHFEGIGIEFVVLNKILTVVSPIVGGPAEAVGLAPGDQIIQIEDKSAYGITEDEVFKKLRGAKGSKVKITVARASQSDPFSVVITRDRIPIYSVYASFMLQDGKTGYIWLARFAKTSSEEMEAALKELEAQGMKQLILDLRYNPGGLLEQATELADLFIPGGQRLVYTRGRNKTNDEDFYSTNSSDHPLMPLVVMIDHGSASASEIVAGAVQDLDRGLVAGQTSFGKGLVQSQIRLKDGAAIRLTVARYFTPSGRLIQRPYDNGLMDYYADAYDDTKEQKADSLHKPFKTRSGRTVLGGGGIVPDSTTKPERITRFFNQLVVKRVFFELGAQYATQHKELSADFARFYHSFDFGDELANDIKAICKKQNIDFSEEAFKKDSTLIKTMVKAEMARNLWDSRRYYMVMKYADSEIRQAVSFMPAAYKILKLGKWTTDGKP
jgi:carboxyl-terminal processing protease